MDKLCPHTSCIYSSAQGLSNGLSYGGKVRFTHALVMAILFSNEPIYQKLQRVLKNTGEHSGKLGLFVLVFKSLVCVLTKHRNKSCSSNHAISGLITGLVWAKDTPVNSQITMYLFSRNLVGHAKLLHKKNLISIPP